MQRGKQVTGKFKDYGHVNVAVASIISISKPKSASVKILFRVTLSFLGKLWITREDTVTESSYY